MISKFYGGDRIRHIVGYYTACRSWSVGYVKSGLKINAEDNTDALLAEAEYIFNNADLFVGVEEDMLLAA